MEKRKSLKNIIQPIAILTFSIIVATVLVGMIAYSNCPETKMLIDNLLGNSTVADSIGQA